ncbi:hypothetical protein COCNU_14G006560 [Cocos nucifera]|uniref:Uncharacterized protein n=1 Tax=Cocos nucifera TaxID=13894 RepID=A0A8K0NCE3_COCNU|nr:hypothetical protein COCNU_14G006560 [Cocos nucifera]
MGKNAKVVTEVIVETSTEAIPISSSVRVISKTEANLSKESKGEAIKAFDSFNSTNALTLEGEDIQHQVSGAFNSLASLSHYLASFVGATSGFSPLELMEAKNELEKLKYYLEQEKAANVDLIKDIDCSKKALSEAQKVINRKDDELSKVCHRIESPLKAGVPKGHHKRKIRIVDERSARIQIEPLSAQQSPVVKEPSLLSVEDFQIIQVPHDSKLPILEEGHEASIEYLFSEAILGLSAPDVPEPFPKEE